MMQPHATPTQNPFPSPSPVTQTPATLSATAPGKNAPLRAKVLDVQRDMKPGSTAISYTIKVELLHNHDVRIIVDNHTKNKMHNDKQKSLHGAWVGTMLDSNLQVNDEIVLNVIHRQQAIWQKIDAESNTVDDLTAQPKRKQRKKNIDVDMLLGTGGIPQIYYKFDATKFGVRPNSEISNLSSLLGMYRDWAYQMCPKVHFQLLLHKIEKFGSNKRVRNYLSNLRAGKLPEECDQMFTGYNNMDGDNDAPTTADGMTPYAKRRKSAHAIDEQDEMKDFIVNSVVLNDDEEEEYTDLNQHHRAAAKQLHRSSVDAGQPGADLDENIAAWREAEKEKDKLEQEQMIDPFADDNDENVDVSNTVAALVADKIASNVPLQTAVPQVVSLFDALDDW